MIKKILVVVAVILIIVVGIVVYAFLRTPEEASGPIEAIPITTDNEATVAETTSETVTETGTAVEEVTPAEEPETQTDTGSKTEAGGEETGGAVAGADAAPESETQGGADNTADPDTETEPTPEAGAGTSGETTESGEAATASPIIFEIVPTESEARFYIDEVLRGTPTTVVGATDQVAGQFSVNPDDLSTTEVGVIQVNARTLATDNDFRNRAIKNRILLTDNHEFITFNPMEIFGLPEKGAVGETYVFQIVGDLTITDVTQQKTFDVTATAVSDTRLEATATTAFLYTDFELFIPDAPAVDTVDDEVRLEVEFVAEVVSGT